MQTCSVVILNDSIFNNRGREQCLNRESSAQAAPTLPPLRGAQARASPTQRGPAVLLRGSV